jgi:very-short-patch-repair endonuclease
MSLKYNRELIPRAKELRRNMTPQEKHLWYDYLAKYPIRFQRQKTIGSFIADFYSHQAKLIIEIDGYQHCAGNGPAYDQERTSILEGLGLSVIRFSNRDIEENFEGVCQIIDDAIIRLLP